jgi:nitrate/nitrite-specific signal transduction histidine kinase
MRLKFRARQRALAENRREDARTNLEMLRRGIRESYADVRELLRYI